MNHHKNQAKRTLAVLLSVLMLLSAWVFVAPAASAEGEEPYAVFDSSAGTLTFVVGTQTASGVERANGDVVSGDNYYTGFTTAAYTNSTSIPWRAQRTNITKVIFLDTISPVSTSNWFYYFTNLTAFEGLNLLDTSSVTNMSSMFLSSRKLTSLDLSGFNTSSVTDMNRMFNGCSSLTTLDLRGFDTSNVTNMESMFVECNGLTTLDLSSFNTSSVTAMYSMFTGCSSLSRLTLGTSFVFKTSPNLPNASSSGAYTGKWIRENSEDAALTAADLMANYDGATMAGTYVWECDHTFDAPVWTWAPDYTSATATWTCTNCGRDVVLTDSEIETEEVSAATCTADQVVKYVASVEFGGETYTGKTDAYTMEGTMLPHSYTVLMSDDDDHWMKCATCDAVTEKEAHASTGTATCIAPAACDVCGKPVGEVDLTNHATTETVLEDAKEPGYTFKGYTGDLHCAACGEIVEYGEHIARLSVEDNASYVLANQIVSNPDKYSPSDVANVNEKLGAVNAALTAENNDEAVIAALAALEAVVETVETVGPFNVTFIVGGEVVDEQTIEAGEAATPPSVPEYVYQGGNHKRFTGWSQDYTRILTDIVITPVYVEEAHDWQDSTVLQAATCMQSGMQRINCACGATDTKVLPIDADYHTGNTVTTRESEVAPTCSAEGSYVEVINCECGYEVHRETKTIAKLPHTPGETVREDVEVSCNEAAGYYDVVYCTVCGQEASRTKHDSGEALGHDWSDWATTSEATCSAEGSKTRTCARCGETETAVIAKTEHPDADGDKVCDSCGYVFPDHSHKDADNNNVCDGCGAVIDTSARCSWCSINDKWEGTIFVGWIVAFIHLFVHLAQTSKFK